MDVYPFNALVARMKYISRWGLMRSSRTETLSEHTADAAILAHTLCLIARKEFGRNVRPETVAVAALDHEKQLLKAADRLSAYIKCIEEERAGNREFSGAKAQQEAAIAAMQCPEADYFLAHMLPCYHWTLDELSAGEKTP